MRSIRAKKIPKQSSGSSSRVKATDQNLHGVNDISSENVYQDQRKSHIMGSSNGRTTRRKVKEEIPLIAEMTHPAMKETKKRQTRRNASMSPRTKDVFTKKQCKINQDRDVYSSGINLESVTEKNINETAQKVIIQRKGVEFEHLPSIPRSVDCDYLLRGTGNGSKKVADNQDLFSKQSRSEKSYLRHQSMSGQNPDFLVEHASTLYQFTEVSQAIMKNANHIDSVNNSTKSIVATPSSLGEVRDCTHGIRRSEKRFNSIAGTPENSEQISTSTKCDKTHSQMNYSTSIAVGKKGYLSEPELSREVVTVLEHWLVENLPHPYPTAEDETEFIEKTGLNEKQIKDWFVHARQRVWKSLMQRKIPLEKRNRTPNPMAA